MRAVVLLAAGALALAACGPNQAEVVNAMSPDEAKCYSRALAAGGGNPYLPGTLVAMMHTQQAQAVAYATCMRGKGYVFDAPANRWVMPPTTEVQK